MLNFDSDSLSQDNIDSLNEYSIEMAKELLKEHESENFVTSPFSYGYPLRPLVMPQMKLPSTSIWNL